MRDEAGIGGGDEERMEDLAREKEAAEEVRDRLASRWQLERETVDRIRALESLQPVGPWPA